MKEKETKDVHGWKSDRREKMGELKYLGSFLIFLFFFLLLGIKHKC